MITEEVVLSADQRGTNKESSYRCLFLCRHPALDAGSI